MTYYEEENKYSRKQLASSKIYFKEGQKIIHMLA